MSVEHIDKLADVLLAINKGEVSEEEAGRVLGGISEVELSLAEQRLLERGVKPEELRGLCAVHLQVLNKEVEDLKKKTGPGHPLYTLVSEHDRILGFLETLDKAAKLVLSRPAYAESDHQLRAALDDIKNVSYHLVETEKHHAREEEALFPAIEAKGITGPTWIMRLEHDDLRPRKKALYELISRARIEDFEEFKKTLSELVSYIGFNLRDHIFKENTILYPAAYKAIVEPETWDEIKARSDEIGYCCFTPGQEVA